MELEPWNGGTKTSVNRTIRVYGAKPGFRFQGSNRSTPLRKAVLSGRIQVAAAVLTVVVERVGNLPTSPGVEPVTPMPPAIVYHFEESIDPLPSWAEDQNPMLDH